MPNTYIALTIGPIYRTFSQAKRTRMLWGASYFFSYLLREIVYELIETQKIAKSDFLIPDVDEVLKCHQNNSSYNGAGIFPDRFIFKSSLGDLKKVNTAIKNVLELIAKKMAEHLLNAHEFGSYYRNFADLEATITSQLQDFLQFYYTEKRIEEKGNILFSLYEDLDAVELQQSYLLDTDHNHLMNFLFRVSLRKPNTKPKDNLVSFLSKDAFDGKKDFESLIEIATKGLIKLDEGKANEDKRYEPLLDKHLRNYKLDPDQQYIDYKDVEDSQEQFLQAVKKNFETEYRNYHKYVAVLYADGDGIGALLKRIGTDSEGLKAFSKKLIDFCKTVSEVIKNFGGSGIYLGGEDIFAFVPIATSDANYQNLQTVFYLTQQFDSAFNTLFDNFEPIKNGVIPKPTLSYGISIAYYKAPLYENMIVAHDLMKKAKYADKRKDTKNTIGIRIEKHSGQYYDAFIEKRYSASYQQIISLIAATTQSPTDTNRKFINSITHKLKDEIFWAMLKEIGDKPDRLDAFFENNFNEGFFKKEPVLSYLISLKGLIISVFKDYTEENNRKQVLYFTLRFIDFVHAKDDR